MHLILIQRYNVTFFLHFFDPKVEREASESVADEFVSFVIASQTAYDTVANAK